MYRALDSDMKLVMHRVQVQGQARQVGIEEAHSRVRDVCPVKHAVVD